MNVATLVEPLASLILVVGPVIALVRLVHGSGTWEATAIPLSIPLDPPWPRGVQEEEPVRWRLECLSPRHQFRGGPDHLVSKACGAARFGAGFLEEPNETVA